MPQERERETKIVIFFYQDIKYDFKTIHLHNKHTHVLRFDNFSSCPPIIVKETIWDLKKRSYMKQKDNKTEIMNTKAGAGYFSKKHSFLGITQPTILTSFHNR